MKTYKLYVPFALLIGVLLAVSLACSSGGGTTVNTPSSGEVTSGASDESTPESTPLPELGTSRSNPAPVGSEIISDDMAFVVAGIVRPADDIVAAGNMFNSTPEPETEYMFINVKITCQKAENDKCSVFPLNFKLITSTGNIIENELMIAGVSDMLESSDLFGGASVEGFIPFIVEKTEANPILMYEPFLGDAFYLKVQ